MPMLESLVLSRFRRVPSKIPTAWSEQTGGEPYCVNQEVRRLYPVRPRGTSPAGHRAREPGAGGACRGADSPKNPASSFLRRKDIRRCYATGEG